MGTSSTTTVSEPSGELVLAGFLGACLVLVATISLAVPLPAAIGVAVAFGVLLAVLVALGFAVGRLLRDADGEHAVAPGGAVTSEPRYPNTSIQVMTRALSPS